MPIPAFNEFVLLPQGLHDCTVGEVEKRFGSFQTSDRRPQLWARFMEFVRQAQAGRLIEELLLDGSFVPTQPDPNDIDVIVVVPASHDFAADLPPHHYNLLAGQRVRRRFGCDILVVRNRSDNQAQAVEFFAQVRQQSGLKKGLLRIKL